MSQPFMSIKPFMLIKSVSQPFAKTLTTLGLLYLGLFPCLSTNAAPVSVMPGASMESELVKTSDSFVRVSEVTVRAVPPGTPNTAAYLEIENLTSESLVLRGGTVPGGARVELHATEYHGDRARMVQQASITLAPEQTLSFRPGAVHIMIMDMKQTPMAGEMIPITLHFNGDRQVTVQGLVKMLMGRDLKHSHTKHSHTPHHH